MNIKYKIEKSLTFNSTFKSSHWRKICTEWCWIPHCYNSAWEKFSTNITRALRLLQFVRMTSGIRFAVKMKKIWKHQRY